MDTKKILNKVIEKEHESTAPYVDETVYDGDIRFIDEAINTAYWEGREEVLRLAEKHPNDMTLGGEVRRLYWDYRHRRTVKRHEENT